MTSSEIMAAGCLEGDGENVVIKMAATGNPDFLVVPAHAISSVRFVEVKAGRDTVKKHQLEVHKNLQERGFCVEVMRVQTEQEVVAAYEKWQEGEADRQLAEFKLWEEEHGG